MNVVQRFEADRPFAQSCHDARHRVAYLLERSVGSVTIGLAIDLRFNAALMLPAAIVIVTGRITMMTSPDMILVPILSKIFLMITGRMVVIPGVGALS